MTVIAILKIGRTYIPIEPNYPGLFIQHILQDTKNTVFISDHVDEIANKLANQNFTGVNFLEIYKINNPLQALSSNVIVAPKNDVACIMYTSGSTGKPKGVIITERGILRATYQPCYLTLLQKDVFLSHSSLAFDASSFEIWGALLNGGTLICVDQQTDLLDYKRLEAIFCDKGVTVLWQTTALFNHYVSHGYSHIYDSLRLLLVGGEPLNKKILKRYLASKTRKSIIVNGYGPTENTIFSTTHIFHTEADVNERYAQVAIGRPIDGTTAIILNEKNQEILSKEMVGELLFGGDGLAQGYLNNADLTRIKFIKRLNNQGEYTQYYSSGDLGYYGEDGLIYYVGRKDTQVKVNGYRIELEEVANAILLFTPIEEVVIKPIVNGNGNLFLSAYLTTFDQNITLEAIKSYLKQKLPNYMIPKYFVVLSALPRNENQKIALDKLPYPLEAPGLLTDKKTSEKQRQYPGTQSIGIEETILQAWMKVLGHNEFTLESNFFDVGGDSIKTISLVDELERCFDKRISIIDLYRCTNISEIAKIFKTLEREV